MGVIEVNEYSFTYPASEKVVLNHVSISADMGEFLLLCGKSGCGKTTLLRCMKPEIAPVGSAEGTITRLSAEEVGFVFQNPDNQIVTDTVRHELAFGLENIGMPTGQIRARVAETALFFGIDEWIDKSVHEISGGEKQLLNLAAVIAMQPKILILDEPTSQLDPVARKNFLDMLVRVNRELGITVILSEHRLEEILPLADRVLFMKEGRIVYSGNVSEFAAYIFEEHKEYVKALPAAARIAKQAEIHMSLNPVFTFPMTVREGQEFLMKCDRKATDLLAKSIVPNSSGTGSTAKEEDARESLCLDVRDIWFQYAKQTPFVMKGLNLQIHWGQMHMLLGGNGSGKSTLLGILSKRFFADRGKIKLGKDRKMPRTALLPQNSKAMFSRDTVLEELESGGGTDQRLIRQLHLDALLHQHPYDLSGGEQQRLALAMVLREAPELLLLDEPTKGLDPFLKEELAAYLKEFTARGNTILCVTHDVEFAAEYGEVCSLLFEGEVLSTEKAAVFFRNNLFYTTDQNRILTSYLADN
ncbi:MAG: ATP-binding cassette domain-containing protein [Hespellia sp.]|nr:ATP-binding cassette domain-containing protein [Hespellia sp.]